MRQAFLLSVALHGGVGLLLIVGALLLSADSVKPPPVLAEVELVEQPTQAVGPAAAASPALLPPAMAAIANPPMPIPKQRALGPAVPPPAPQSAAAAHPSDAAAAGTGLVSGGRVIPAALDRAARNVPPAYPPEAVRRGEQGAVILMVHVAVDGSASAVDVIQSSGHPLLDHAARQAVAAWHFIPGRSKGTAVSSTMPIRIRFVLDEPVSRQ